MSKTKKKLCLISSSGGHFEQLKMLTKLEDKYNIYVVTEKTNYNENCDYTLFPGNCNKFKSAISLFLNMFLSLFLILKEKPDVIISTGTMVAFPTILWAKLLGKKVIYIETFACVKCGTNCARFIYKHHLYDLFIYQWENLRNGYPDGVYGGGIY